MTFATIIQRKTATYLKIILIKNKDLRNILSSWLLDNEGSHFTVFHEADNFIVFKTPGIPHDKCMRCTLYRCSSEFILSRVKSCGASAKTARHWPWSTDIWNHRVVRINGASCNLPWYPGSIRTICQEDTSKRHLGPLTTLQITFTFNRSQSPTISTNN